MGENKVTRFCMQGRWNGECKW